MRTKSPTSGPTSGAASRERLGRRLAAWVAAEAAPRDAEPEQALDALFEAMPMPQPKAGFADRVMARVAAERRRAAARQRSWTRPWMVAAALVVSSLAALLPLALRDAFATFGLAGLLERLAAAVAGIAHWLAEVAVVADKVEETLPVLAPALESLPVAALVVGMLALALLAIAHLSHETPLTKAPWTQMRGGRAT